MKKESTSTLSSYLRKAKANIYEVATYSVWAISWASVLGSLYFSEVAKFLPCNLCWWQRVIMYPLAIFSTVAIVRKDYKNFAYYALPFGILGVIASFYHSLLQWGIITENVLDCSVGANVSCADPEINVFGFITIPFLAFLGFAAITAVSSIALYIHRTKK